MKYDFKNQKVNDFYQSLNYSAFISRDFIINLGGLFSTAISHHWQEKNALPDELEYNKLRNKSFFEDVKRDINRISIFTEAFKIEIIDNLALLLWPEIEDNSEVIITEDGIKI